MKMGPTPGNPAPARVEADIRKFLSVGRAAGRFVLQRIVFRGVVNFAITQKVRIASAVHELDGAFVLVANHSSHVDAPILAQGLPRKQARFLATGVAKDYFFDRWYLRWFVRWLFNAYPVDRDGSGENAGLSRRILKLGAPVLVFPEGGRQTSGRLGAFGAGAASNAIKVGVPVLPAAIIGAHEAMPKGKNWPKKGRPPVGVVVGDPLHAGPGEEPEDFTQRIRDTISDLYFSHYESIVGVPHPVGPEGAGPDPADPPGGSAPRD